MIAIKPKSQQTETPVKPLANGQENKPAPAAETGVKRQTTPFTGADGSRDYRAIYADIFKFHEAHNPPDISDTSGDPDGYWWTVGIELTQLSKKYGGDEFANNLLMAVFTELEREYNG